MGHYQFGKKSKEAIAPLGEMSVDNLIINTIAPLLTAYGKLRDEQDRIDRIVHILQQVPGESNAITKQWLGLGVKTKTAFDSQALIELYNNFCLKRRCLECNVGSALVKPLRQ